VTIVSDASPLITLAKIGRLELLPQLYRAIIVTSQVYAEVVSKGSGLAGSSEIANAKWIVRKAVDDAVKLSTMQEEFGLGIGEVSTILLGKELNADVLLVDEAKARKAAQRQGLSVLGCVGVLEDGFGRRLVADLPQIYRQLIASGAYIDRRILENSLKALNQPPL